MIRLYLPPGYRDDDIREAIAEMSLAVQIVSTPPQPVQSAQPVLWDDEIKYEGKTAILQFLEEMAQFKAEWDKFQSDTCYCDDEGEIE